MALERLPVAATHQAVAADCSSLGPCGERLQHARNTQFEFVLTGFAALDKGPVSQHAGVHCITKTNRFGFDWGWP
jgi:hypothetical protein